MRKIGFGLIVIIFLLLPSPIYAYGNPFIELPSDAIKISQNVYKLRDARDPETGKIVEGYVITHPLRKNSSSVNQSPVILSANSCYGFMAEGAKWKRVEKWFFNTRNTRSLSGDTLMKKMKSGIRKWEDAANGKMGDGIGRDILGGGERTTATLVADTNYPDGKNEVFFAKIFGDGGFAAVTYVWGVFTGDFQYRELYEWDQVYNDIDFNWSFSGDPNKLDFANIVTHELGHSIGLLDLYSSECSSQTMYGYSTYGETSKRSLNTGDILGTDLLY